VWSDPATPAAPAQKAAGAQSQPQPASAVIGDSTLRRAPKERAAAAAVTQAAAAGLGADTASVTTGAQNVLVILFAALLAGAVFTAFAVLRRRMAVKIRGAHSGPRFGSGRGRDDGLRLKWPHRESETRPAAPIQSSLIPQQVSVMRPSGSRR
jgi:hypothetical protein